MVTQMEKEGFGDIQRLTREYARALVLRGI
jgi:hypothetical protein